MYYSETVRDVLETCMSKIVAESALEWIETGRLVAETALLILSGDMSSEGSSSSS